MEARRLLPDWPLHREALRERWPLLTQGDLLAIDGEIEYLVEALQSRYSLTRAEAQVQSDEFVAALGTPEAGGPAAGARASLAPGVAKIREGLAELGLGLRTLAGDTVERGRDAARETGAELGELRETARDTAQRVAQRSDEVLERTGRYIRERPFTSLGIAFVAGWLLLGRK